MRELQKLLDSLIEELDAYTEQRRKLQLDNGEVLEGDSKAYYYYLGKEAGMRNAVKLAEYHIKHKKIANMRKAGFAS